MSTFSPNLINEGGKQMLVNLRVNHYSSLLNAKPVVNSHIPPAKSGAKPKKQTQDLLENLQALHKVENVRSRTDHSKPETIDMAKKLSDYKKRKADSKSNSHSSNLQIMQQRINRYENPVEQKKNEFNYKANPVVLFRSNSSDKHGKTVIKSKKEGDIYTIIQKQSKAQPKSRSKAKPVNLKELLLNEIIESQIWTDEDLAALFDRTRENYPNEPDLDSAIEYVRSEVLS